VIGLYVLILLVPSVNYQVFSGLPLSHAAEYLFGAALLPLVVHKALRTTFARFLTANRFLAPGLWAAAGVALVIKVALFASGDYRGLQACYGSPLSPPPAGRCEASYENPLSRFGVTRIDERVDFGPTDWNLSFLNSLRFNIYPWVNGNRLRDRLPLSATWGGWVQAPDTRVVEVDYVGEGQILIGGSSVVLPPSYTQPRQVAFTLPEGTHRVLAHYRFDDHSQVGRPAPGPYAIFRLRFQDDAGAPADVVLAPPTRLRGLLTAAARVADLLVVILGVALLAFYLRLLLRDWWWFGLTAAVWWLAPGFVESTSLPIHAPKGIAACTVVLLVMLRRRHARDVIGAFFALVAVGFALLSPAFADVEAVALRAAGDDWLTYESFARSILELRSLEGGEPVFYYQPLFRYVRFTEHLLLGDGDLLIVVSAYASLVLAMVWMLRRFNRRESRLSLGVCLGAGVLMLTLATSATGGMRFLTLGASEYPTWVLLFTMLPRLFVSRSVRAQLSGTVMTALSALTRFNQLPALLAIFAAYVFRTRGRLALLVGAFSLVLAILMLAPAHNLYYGGRAEWTTTSSDIPENYVLPVTKAAAAVYDPDVRATLASQLKLVLALSGIERGWALLWPALHGLQILWIGTLAWAIASRRLTLWSTILAATPALYLGAHVFYQAQGHYPRHILAGHFMMGAAAAIIVFVGWRGKEPNFAGRH
jgi:hypothetical protein